MALDSKAIARAKLAVLHPVFALTGVIHAVGGALLPSLASRFHLTDATSGLLFLLYFAGTSLGALLCRGHYARLMTIGFAALVFTCLGIACCPRALLTPAFLLLGISVGVPMSAVTLLIGRDFPERSAPMLTFLNFSWSIGALAAPLIAARILMRYEYRTAYVLLSVASAMAAVACGIVLRDPSGKAHPVPESAPKETSSALSLVALFAFAAFLQVGVENTVTAWLPTYALRTAESDLVLAAVSSSFYWAGFLLSRGLASLLLMRVSPTIVFRISIALGIVAALFLEIAPSVASRNLAMFFLGAALAPTYPLVLANFFSRSARTADSRWILFTAGFGGSAIPWLAGILSASTGSLRIGMILIPAALLLMFLIMPALRGPALASDKPLLR